MPTRTVHPLVRLSQITTLLRSGVIGILIAEAFSLSIAIADSLNRHIVATHHEYLALFLSFASLLIISGYFVVRGGLPWITQLVQSRRLDLLFILTIGIILSHSFHGLGKPYYQRLVSLLTPLQTEAILAFPITLGLL